MSNENNNNEEVNPYLAMRQAKIARNQKRLRELGLQFAPPPPQPSSSSASASATKQKPLASHGLPVRRSRRISSRIQPDYKDISLPGDHRAVGVGRKRPRSPDFELDESSSSSSPVVVASSSEAFAASIEKDAVSIGVAPKQRPSRNKPSCAPAANSVRSIDLDIKALILGMENNDNNNNNNNNGLLGRMMEHAGKEHIIHHSFSLAAPVTDRQRLSNTKLSFNKYSGVQDWNNAIFLWVNLNTGDSPNEFLEGGRQITWFGGSRMRDESPVIVKLVKFGKEGRMVTKKDEEGGGDGTSDSGTSDCVSSNIVLWCRRHQPEIKKFTPYVCFGRLGYRSHVIGSNPLSFVWDLLDYDGLKCHGDLAVRENFELFTKCEKMV